MFWLGTDKLLSWTQALRGKAGSLTGGGNVGEYVEDGFEQGKEKFKLSFEWLGKQALSLEVAPQERERGRKAHQIN